MSKVIANYMAMWARAFDFKGRSSVSEYWYAVLGNIIVTLGFSIGVGIIGGLFEGLFGVSFVGSILIVILYLFSLASSVAGISLAVRRLHDIGLSGWLYLISLTGIGSIVLIVLFCKEGEPANKWGANPKSNI